MAWSYEAHGNELAMQLSCDSRACCQSTFQEGKSSRSTLEEHPTQLLRAGPDSG